MPDPEFKPTIISVVSNKGGVAKTTTAINLAGIIHEKSPACNPIVVDADNNASATIYDKKGLLPFVVTKNVDIATSVLNGAYEGNIAQLHPVVILDTAANLPVNALKQIARVSDLVILPTTPDLFAVAGVQALTTSSPIAKANYIVLVTMAPTSSNEGQEVISQLRSANYPVFGTPIRYYQAYRHAVNAGKVVGKMKSRRGAWLDWQNVYQEISQRVRLQTKPLSE